MWPVLQNQCHDIFFHHFINMQLTGKDHKATQINLWTVGFTVRNFEKGLIFTIV